MASITQQGRFFEWVDSYDPLEVKRLKDQEIIIHLKNEKSEIDCYKNISDLGKLILEVGNETVLNGTPCRIQSIRICSPHLSINRTLSSDDLQSPSINRALSSDDMQNQLSSRSKKDAKKSQAKLKKSSSHFQCTVGSSQAPRNGKTRKTLATGEIKKVKVLSQPKQTASETPLRKRKPRRLSEKEARRQKENIERINRRVTLTTDPETKMEWLQRNRLILELKVKKILHIRN